VELLDHPRLTAQMCGLERRTPRGGRDSIDHAPGGHDDIANSVAGAVVAAAQREVKTLIITPWFSSGPPRESYDIPTDW
jgi:hypothetical protein